MAAGGWTSEVTRRALSGAWWQLSSMLEIGYDAGARVVWLLRASCWVRASQAELLRLRRLHVAASDRGFRVSPRLPEDMQVIP